VVGAADINQDGAQDIVLQNATTGQVGVLYMNGDAQLGYATFSGTTVGSMSTMKVVAVKDMNGDGHPDLVLQNTTTGGIVIWYYNGVTFQSSASVTSSLTGWNVVGAGDYNGDGHPDLLLQAASGGETIVWYMNGAVNIGSAVIFGSLPAGWNVVGMQ